MIQKNETTKKLNVIDVIIIIVMVLALVSIGFRIYYMVRPDSNQDLKTYEVTIKIENIHTSVPDSLDVSDIIYDSEGNELGKLKSMSNGLAMETTKAIIVNEETGTSFESPVTDKVDAVGILVTKGIKNSDDIFNILGKYTLVPGQSLKLHTETVDFVVEIVAISEYGA